MKYIKVDRSNYFQINVVCFNNWNRIFERCMHILQTDLGLPYSEEVSVSLLHFLKMKYPPKEINSIGEMSDESEMKFLDSFLSSSLAFLIDIN